ncbi:hypothetical protein [Magnetospirillum molischianum]|uniref:Uncharacterized protein n=1 Tax=Magnetospirillum molischianum DSM 120 TaxID=1150626 RepID=H8FY55_MAGML|nr:hypothetical protein [Magnetospirillum molischianum]CCG43293.1 conserved hypothetical protein [Magnetospirillum molischianum DSM 120]
MASDTKNVKLGVCKITFGGTDLGYTKGGVEVEVTTEVHKVTIDQFGTTSVADLIQGRNIKVKVPLAETTLENLVKIMPGATLVTDGTTPTKKRVDVQTGIGINLLDVAQEMILHPVSKADADVSEDFIIPKAATAGALNFAYKVDQERIFNTEFSGYPDPETKVLFKVGDKTAVAA